MAEFGICGELEASFIGIRERFGGVEARLSGVETRLSEMQAMQAAKQAAVARMEAGTDNYRIMAFNRSHSSSLRPLKKMVSVSPSISRT